jgi:hypothetical protein
LISAACNAPEKSPAKSTANRVSAVSVDRFMFYLRGW